MSTIKAMLVGVLAFAAACHSSSHSGQPVTVVVTPSALSLNAGESRQFSATVTNSADQAVAWSLDEGAGGGSISPSGLYTAPAAPGTYHVRATAKANPGKSGNAAVTVAAAPAPVISSFTATPPTINAGQSSTLGWTVTDASSLTIDNGVGTVTGTSVQVSPAAATTYTLTATSAGGSTTAKATVVIAAPGSPVISAFSAAPSGIQPGQSSTLSWTVTGAASLSIDNGVGAVAGTSTTVAPSTTTTYTLTATNSAGSVIAVAKVGVAPLISAFTADPASIATGQSSTLSWTVAGASSLSIDNGIGAVTGTSWVVAPAATLTYTLTAESAGGSATAQATVTITSGYLAPSPVTGDVIASMDTHSVSQISPYIYGLNFAELGGPNGAGAIGTGRSLMWTTAMPKYTLNRFGGNRTTGFNWETGDSNCGSDCGYSDQAGSFRNDANLVDNLGVPAGVGAAIKPRVDLSAAAGASTLLTVPIFGSVARDAAGQQPIPTYPSHTSPGTPSSAHWLTVQPGDPAGATATPNTSDGFVYSDDYVKWVDTRFPGKISSGSIQFELDNEPDIWKGTHAEIAGTATGTYTSAVASNDANQLALPFNWYPARSLAHAAAIKATAPGAMVWAGAFASFDGLTQFNYGSHPNGPPCADGSEAPCSGAALPQYTWYFDYLLDQYRNAGTSAGHRLVDVFDIHWYVQGLAGGAISVVNDDAAQTPAVFTAREQSTRSLWDPSYIEGSWINGSIPSAFQAGCNAGGNCPIALLKHLQDSVAAHYPGTRIAIGEYWYGRGGDISSTVANADFLGILARLGIYAATMWPNASNVWAYNTPNGCNNDSTCTANHAYQCAMKALDVYRNYDGAGAKFGNTYVPTRPGDPTFTSPGTQDERFTAYASMDASNATRIVIVAINKTPSTSLQAGFQLTHTIEFHTVEQWTVTGTNGGGGGCTGPTRGPDIPLTLTNAFNATLPPQSVTALVMKP